MNPDLQPTPTKSTVRYALKSAEGSYFTDSKGPAVSGTGQLSIATTAPTIPQLLKKFERYFVCRHLNCGWEFSIIRIEETAGTEVRRLLTDREGCREDEQIKYAVFNVKTKNYTHPAPRATAHSLDGTSLFDKVEDAIAWLRLVDSREGRRIAVSTTPPTITETILA